MDENLFALDKLFRSPEIVNFTTLDVLLSMLISTVLCIALAYTYKGTHRGTSYSISYVHTLFIMSIATSVIMLIIGSNIARAFSLVGALSVIRFRTAVKDARDTGYLFASVAVGMACGTGFYLPAIIFTGFFGVLMAFLHYSDFGKKGSSKDYILRISYSGGKTTSDKIQECMKTGLKEYTMINRIAELENGREIDVFSVLPAKKIAHEELENQLKEVEGVLQVSYYQSYQPEPAY